MFNLKIVLVLLFTSLGLAFSSCSKNEEMEPISKSSNPKIQAEIEDPIIKTKPGEKVDEDENGMFNCDPAECLCHIWILGAAPIASINNATAVMASGATPSLTYAAALPASRKHASMTYDGTTVSSHYGYSVQSVYDGSNNLSGYVLQAE